MSDTKIYDNTKMEGLLKYLLSFTLKDAMSMINAQCGSLFLFDAETKELVLDAFYNSANLRLKGLRQRIGEGICGKVADIGTPILVKDLDRDLRFKRNGFNHYKTKSFISIPLFTSRGLLGLINLTDKSSNEQFSEKDLEFAITISRYACLVIDGLYKCIGLRQEKETLDKQKSLLEKYASVGKLAAGVVHEINNPLDGVIRYTNILLGQIEHSSIAREYLLEVKKGLNRIANITKSLLEFSRQVNSHSSQVKKYVDVHSLINDSLDILSSKLNSNVIVDKKYRDNLPRVLDLGIAQVVINLIKNAVDAMPEGGRLEISTDIRDSVLEISFKDTGWGIPVEIKERIFEPFFTTKGIGKGTGLGLSISNEIINKYEGRIEVQSYLGRGSTFTVVIPKRHLEDA